MPGSGGGRIIEQTRKPVTRQRPARVVGLVDGIRRKVGVHLQKRIGGQQTFPVQLALERGAGVFRRLQLLGRPQVRTPLKQPNVDALEFEHRNQLEHAGVGKQRKGKIGAGKSIRHGRASLVDR